MDISKSHPVKSQVTQKVKSVTRQSEQYTYYKGAEEERFSALNLKREHSGYPKAEHDSAHQVYLGKSAASPSSRPLPFHKKLKVDEARPLDRQSGRGLGPKEAMRRYPKKFELAAVFPALRAEVRELVHLPRRNPDIAATFAYEPVHVNEAALGSLFLVGHIEDALLQEQTMLNALFLELRRTYYHGAKGLAEERFHRTLQQLNTYLREHTDLSLFAAQPVRCHMHVMAIADGTVLVSEIGSAFSYLVRDGIVSSISHKNPPELASSSAYPFTHLVRGRLLPEDRLVAVTPHFVDTTIREKIDSAFLSPELLEELVQHARTHLAQDVHSANRAAAALIIRIAENFPHTAPLRPPGQQYPVRRASSSALDRMLEDMTPAAKGDGEQDRLMPPVSGQAFFPRAVRRVLVSVARWYVLIPLASLLLFSGVVPRIAETNSETRSRILLNSRLGLMVEQVQTALRGQSQMQKRSLLVGLARNLDEPLTHDAIQKEAVEARKILENGMRQIDRLARAEVVIISDFSKLAIEFSPEIILENGERDYFIAERSLVQLLRATQNASTRFLITGVANPGKVLAIAKTAEDPPRLALLTPRELALLEPHTKAYRVQHVKLPKNLSEPLWLTSGMREIFAVSQSGAIARKLLNEKRTDAFSALPLGKPYAATRWLGAAVLSPALYLLSEDQRIIQVVGGKVASDTPLALGEDLGSRIRLRGLTRLNFSEQNLGGLAILDEEKNRIILASPDGSVQKQYRHALFTGMRDIIESSDGILLLLTETLLLEISG